MKQLNSVLLIFFIAVLTFPAQAQNGKIKKGDKYYEWMAYPMAIRKYEKGLKKDRDLRAMERIADAYRQVGNTEKAERWYAEVVASTAAAPVNMLYYGQMLKANGKYNEARKWFESYLQTGEAPKVAARFIESCDFAIKGRTDSTRYMIKAEPFNSKRSEFSPIITTQGMVFAAEKPGGCARRLNLRNENYFYDLYTMERSSNKKGYKLKRLKGKVNTKYHEGPAVMNRKQNMLYFTRSNYVKDKKAANGKNSSRLKVLSASISKGKWKNIEELPFNSEQYSCGHPALSKDGNLMVFSSDIPGGFGGTDLYMSRKEGDTWSTPQNLGSAINTEGDESFPYLHPSGALFFASTGLPGFGGYDIFSAKRTGASWGQPINMGYPLNTSRDEFTMAWINNRPAGYFASDRDGDDDIYMFTRKMEVQGTVVDSRTGTPLDQVAVSVLDANGKESKYTTDEKGQFTHMGQWGKDYFITASKAEYLQNREQFSSKDLNPMEDLVVNMKLERDMLFSVSGRVTDATTGMQIPDAKVRIIATKGKTYSTNEKGEYFTKVLEDREYAVIVMKEGYVPQIFDFSTEGKTEPEDFVFNAALEPGNYLMVEGNTLLRENEAVAPGVNIRAVDAVKREEHKATRSRKDGRFWMVLNPAQENFLVGTKEGYFSSRADLPLPDSTRGDTTVSVTLYMVKYEIGAIVKIIYYDYNQSNIKKIASKELFEIVYFLQDNPEVSVALASHTDARGGDKFNLALSKRRSDAAVSYIVSREIERKRVKAEGLGESQLVNKCRDGIECSDQEHAANRRTEIRVTKLDMSKAKESWKKTGYYGKEAPLNDMGKVGK